MDSTSKLSFKMPLLAFKPKWITALVIHTSSLTTHSHVRTLRSTFLSKAHSGLKRKKISSCFGVFNQFFPSSWDVLQSHHLGRSVAQCEEKEGLQTIGCMRMLSLCKDLWKLLELWSEWVLRKCYLILMFPTPNTSQGVPKGHSCGYHNQWWCWGEGEEKYKLGIGAVGGRRWILRWK